jgi:hypothetical protein
MIKHEEVMANLKEIAENITSKQWQKLTSKIEKIRGYITEQEKKDEIIEGVKEILALNYSYQEIGVKISRLFKRIEEETK